MPQATPNGKTIAVIDGNSLMHRAFHAISQPMQAPDGRPTNALFGFFNMFVKFYESFSPDGMICAFDKGRPRVRMEMLPQYKAQRPSMDPDLRAQFPMVKELLKAMRVPVMECEGWEGDDILGTLARRGEQAGYTMLLVTGDRDMYQLSTDLIHIVSTRKGITDVSIMTPDTVSDLYNGITPELVPDFYGLKGDSSDNIPGVPGIGPKKAAALILQYGSLDEVLAHADEVKGKMGENLRAHKDDALLSRKVATIRTDAPIELELSDAHFPAFTSQEALAEVSQAFSDLGFTGVLQRIVALAGGTVKAPQAACFELPKPVDTKDASALVASAISNNQWVGVALEQGSTAGQLTLDLDDANNKVLWVATNHALARFDGDEALVTLQQLFEAGKIVSSDVKQLVHALMPSDSAQVATLTYDKIDPARIFDTGVAGYLLDSDKPSFSTAALAQHYLKTTLPQEDKNFSEQAIDAWVVHALQDVLVEQLKQTGSDKLFTTVEMSLLAVLAVMERHGLGVDAAVLRNQSQELGVEIDRMVEHIQQEAGEKFKVNSPEQLSHVLFDVWRLPTFGLKKTKKGFYSTNAKVLSELAHEDTRVAEVLEYRERTKIKSTYLDALPELIRGDGRIHTSFNQTVAATGRLSSSDPNLQNIPTRSELGHRVRTAFSVPEDSVFLACDYSQIELRLLAHLSNDEHLIAAFNSGADFHAATAARVFAVPVEEVTPALRSRAKAVNFGIVYGQQAYGLATSLGIPRAEAQQMIDRYFAAYPGVDAYLKQQIKLAHEQGFVSTMYGRRRYTADINNRNFQLRSFAERTAMNHPMQGSAADIIKIAMVRVQDTLVEKRLRSKLVLQIHDELDLEVPINELEIVSKLVKEQMESVCHLSVPLIAEPSYGNNWAEAK
ncbi:DNA polymerase I [Atopobium fossor]|uniref:DNA polymerase I n=1 Tax=Atopobium fossor TaxID=39487 RepID=UPI00041767D0|nr:DNA polymerase I [Atopobium fossor]